MEKSFIDYANYYAKVKTIEEKLDKKLADKREIKLHLFILYEKIDKLKERLDVLEKKFND